jgi:hypothetical protein
MRNNLCFTIIFILCWLPTGFFRLPLDLPRELLPEELRSNLMYYSDVCGILGYFHTCVIPILLFALSHDLRKYLCFTNNYCLSKADVVREPSPGEEDEEGRPQGAAGDLNQNDKLDRKI